MFNPMRLGIVGFGRLAENYYLPALARMQEVATVCAIADPTEPRRALAAKLLPNAKEFETQSQMLNDAAPLDGILVASPPAAHLDALNELSNRPPIAVFVEKPLVPPGQLESPYSIRAETQQRITLNFNRRSWPRYQQLAAVVRDGRIGTLQSVELELQVDVMKWLAVTSHRIDKGQGGALYDLGSQLIDLAGVILGERPTHVRAEASSTRWEADHVTVQLTFA